jgi:DNA mismatch repair protein MutS2
LVKNTRRQVEHLVQGLDKGSGGGVDSLKAREARRAMNEKLKNLETAPEKRRGGAVSLAPGDEVVLKSSGIRGTVEECDDDRRIAAIRLEGGLKVNGPYEDLAPAPPETEKKKGPVVRGPLQEGAGRLEVDVRGCRADEAITVVDKFLDDALISGQPFARVIHGKGTGKLREALHEHLKAHKAGFRFRLGEWGEGDYGVTIVDLK